MGAHATSMGAHAAPTPPAVAGPLPKSPNGENCQHNLLKLTTAPAALLPIVLMTYLGLWPVIYRFLPIFYRLAFEIAIPQSLKATNNQQLATNNSPSAQQSTNN